MFCEKSTFDKKIIKKMHSNFENQVSSLFWNLKHWSIGDI